MLTAMLLMARCSRAHAATARAGLGRSEQHGRQPRQVVVRTAGGAGTRSGGCMRRTVRSRRSISRPRWWSACSSGSRPSAGFAVEILGVEERAGRSIVRYRETAPREGRDHRAGDHIAYQLVAVPRRPATSASKSSRSDRRVRRTRPTRFQEGAREARVGRVLPDPASADYGLAPGAGGLAVGARRRRRLRALRASAPASA